MLVLQFLFRTVLLGVITRVLGRFLPTLLRFFRLRHRGLHNAAQPLQHFLSPNGLVADVRINTFR